MHCTNECLAHNNNKQTNTHNNRGKTVQKKSKSVFIATNSSTCDGSCSVFCLSTYQLVDSADRLLSVYWLYCHHLLVLFKSWDVLCCALTDQRSHWKTCWVRHQWKVWTCYDDSCSLTPTSVSQLMRHSGIPLSAGQFGPAVSLYLSNLLLSSSARALFVLLLLSVAHTYFSYYSLCHLKSEWSFYKLAGLSRTSWAQTFKQLTVQICSHKFPDFP